MAVEWPPGVDFSHAGEPMPGIPTTCPHCHRDFERFGDLEEFTEVYGTEGEQTWWDDIDDNTSIEVTVTWSTSYGVIDLREL